MENAVAQAESWDPPPLLEKKKKKKAWANGEGRRWKMTGSTLKRTRRKQTRESQSQIGFRAKCTQRTRKGRRNKGGAPKRGARGAGQSDRGEKEKEGGKVHRAALAC